MKLIMKYTSIFLLVITALLIVSCSHQQTKQKDTESMMIVNGQGANVKILNILESGQDETVVKKNDTLIMQTVDFIAENFKIPESGLGWGEVHVLIETLFQESLRRHFQEIVDRQNQLYDYENDDLSALKQIDMAEAFLLLNEFTTDTYEDSSAEIRMKTRTSILFCTMAISSDMYNLFDTYIRFAKYSLVDRRFDVANCLTELYSYVLLLEVLTNYVDNPYGYDFCAELENHITECDFSVSKNKEYFEYLIELFKKSVLIESESIQK